MHNSSLHWVASGGVLVLLAGLGLATDVPPTPTKPVTDVYHGVKVVDDYRWLEDIADPVVHAWSSAQNARARGYLDALPVRVTIYERLTQLYGHPSPRYFALKYRGDQLFALKIHPPKQQAALVVLQTPDDTASERVVIDPTQLDSSGTTVIDFYVPSIDGKHVAVSLSKAGSESGDVHVYEVTSGRPLPDAIPRVNGGTAGGSLAWNTDSTGFYYTRYPRAGERPKQDMSFYQQVYFHRLGADTGQDTYAVGKEFPRIAEVALQSSEDGRYILAAVANGDGGGFENHLLGPSGEWHQITQLADQIAHAEFGLDGYLYLLSRQNAPRGKILRLLLQTANLKNAKVVVPQSGVVIRSFLPTHSRLYVSDLIGGPSQVRIFDLAGHYQGTVPIPEISAIPGWSVTRSTNYYSRAGAIWSHLRGIVSTRRHMKSPARRSTARPAWISAM